MKIENTSSPAVVAAINDAIGQNVTIHLNADDDLQFNYHGKLEASCLKSEDRTHWVVCRPGGPEITFSDRAVRKVYCGPSRELAIYLR